MSDLDEILELIASFLAAIVRSHYEQGLHTVGTAAMVPSAATVQD